MTVQDLRAIALFDGLADEQLADLLTVGEELRFADGEELFREARPADYWWVLLEGAISLSRHVGREETVLGRMQTPGQWAGGFRAWDEHGVYMATGRGVVPGRVLRVPAEMLADRATEWFPFAVHLIRGLVHTARNIESMARQREALVALGTLAAGLAHEINNPASAAARAVDTLEDTVEVLLGAVGQLADGSLSTIQYAELDRLRQAIEPQPGSMEPLAVADREDAVSDWLAAHGVDREWLIAPPLAAAGLDVEWCERAAAVLGEHSLGAGLEWLASSLSTGALLSEVKESTRRISALIASVRSYSQLDRSSLQRTDLAEGLESTLVMLGHRLAGITVVRDYGPGVPPIPAIAAELNQVWTNLMVNALDALNGVGILRVSTRVDQDVVVVEIGDTGSGMPKDVQDHAFEPFYTTKDVGQGTGLGLDISRRIVVERHGGEITIDVRPDETVLRVRLPLRRTEA